MTLADVAPGDVITFGDHTGWYRVRRLDYFGGCVTVRSWFRRARTEQASTQVWEKQ